MFEQQSLTNSWFTLDWPKTTKTTYFKHQLWTLTYKHINSMKFNISIITHQLGAQKDEIIAYLIK